MSRINQYDRNNVPLFESGSQNHYLCSICGQYTTLADSTSHKGYNLICNRCGYKIAGILNLTFGEIVRYVQDAGLLKDKSYTEMLDRMEEIKGEYNEQ